MTDEKSPSAPLVELPEDFDQYEHPYNYDNELPDDAELEEQKQTRRDQE